MLGTIYRHKQIWGRCTLFAVLPPLSETLKWLKRQAEVRRSWKSLQTIPSFTEFDETLLIKLHVWLRSCPAGVAVVMTLVLIVVLLFSLFIVEKLKFSDFHMSQMMDNTVADLQSKFLVRCVALFFCLFCASNRGPSILTGSQGCLEWQNKETRWPNGDRIRLIRATLFDTV
jgi:hypothetical protein